ncbi:hypothetical protein BS47DRAFT_1368990 [Hydnum rufescens UP504]|uniref:Uncharacterized protein n=1 Tax=Hydnum rufescens UP504 TaxID=1448309 RepID=A0A9P6AF18_9AGAM|nr:hypothetical protein BS47DRAFT_1368990 [Hydnum rufescens UP504]
MSGLEEAMNNERNPKDLARLEAERAMRLEARQARAAELAEEHAEWRRRTKGKGKETEVEADDEAKEEEFDEAHTKPLVSRLTKSQTERVKQQAEEERERYAALAQEMQVPTELVLQTAHAQTGKSRGGPWNDFTRLYSAENPDHGNRSQSKLENIFGSSRAPILKKLGKDLSEKSRQNYNLYDLAAVGFVTALDPTDGAAIANASVFAPSKKIGDIVEQIFWTPANKRKFIALNLAEAETFEPLIKGWEAYAEANPLEDLHSTVSGKLLEMANRVLKQNGVLESWAKKGWPYVGLANVIYDLLNKDKGVSFRIHNWPSTCPVSKKAETYIQSELKCVLQSIVVGFVKGAHSRQEGYPLVIPGTILYMEAFSRGYGGWNLPLVFDQKKNPLLHLWDSTKWRKMDAAQKAKEGKNRAKMNKALWDTGGKSSAIVNVVSSDLEDTPPSFREASDDGSGAEIAPQRSSKTKLLLAKRRHPAKNQTWAVVKEGVNPLIGGRTPP